MAAPDRYTTDHDVPLRGTRERRMSLVTETLARAAVTGTAFPPKAKCPDFPLATFFYMDAAPSDEDLMDTMRRIVSFDRLRSKVVSTGKKGRFQWSEMDNAEERLMDHVSRREVSSESKLRDAMDQLLLTPLDVDKPLWDITVLTLCDGATWNPSPGGPDRKPPVVCVRVSHAIGDGISLVSILNRMCGGDVQTVDFKRRANTSYSLSACVSNPMKILYFFVWVFNCIYAVITAVGTPFGPHDSKTAFCDTSKKVVYSGKRTMVNCPGFALSDLKEVKTKMGCTVNDVVCACLAGALHKYQEYRSDPRARRSSLVRAAIAIPFLGRAPGALCNDWTFVSLSLVMGPMSIVDRLKKTQRRCHLMKSTPGAHAVSALNVVAAKLLGPSFQSDTIYDFMSRHSMVFTNVPGPTAPVTMFRNQVTEMTFGVGNLVNQVSVVSYAGKMGISLVVDPDEVPDAHLIGDYFREELDALLRL